MFKTNIQRGKGSRRRPEPGDIFGLYVPSKGWLFGRVVRTDVFAFSGVDEVLIYIYDAIRKERQPLPELSRDRLLIPPIMTNLWPWKGGWFHTLKTGPSQPGDVFERHCFRSGLIYHDELTERITTPFEPCGQGGLASMKFIDDKLSGALGLSWVPEGEEEEKAAPKRPGRTSKCTVTLFLPLEEDERDEELEVDELEDRLGSALTAAGAGTWEGHGFNMGRGLFDTRFIGPDGPKLLAALSRAIKKLKPPLPQGWYATVHYGDGEEKRVEL